MNPCTETEFDPLTSSFRQLKEAVARTAGMKLPSAKELRESGFGVLFTFEHGDVEITVYLNGFFIYKCYGKETVSAVDRCRRLVYEYQDGEIRKMEEAEFRDGPCLIPLLMTGDERVAHNMDSYEWYWNVFSLNSEAWDWTVEASTESAEGVCLHDEDISQLRDGLAELTERQRKIIHLYYVEGLSQYEIAKLLNVGRSSVERALKASVRRLKNGF